jgi:8-oxo-dGTP diphosphatase
MEFQNKPNKVVTVNGEQIVQSRSCGTCTHIICRRESDGHWFVLALKRSEYNSSEVGKWCVPGGYLDWNETASQAAIREIWEECNINILEMFEEYSKNKRLGYEGLTRNEPWGIDTNPENIDQTIVINFGALVATPKELPPLNSNSEEIEEIKWIDVADLGDYDWAFNQQRDISSFISLIMSMAKQQQ